MKLNHNNYVDFAEKAINNLLKRKDRKGRPISIVTTSKLRNLLSMTQDIYNEVINSKEETLSEEMIGRINYLKIRVIYEAGRDESVKALVEEAELIDHINEINGSRQQYILFSRYMEALVAFRKFYGGRDDN